MARSAERVPRRTSPWTYLVAGFAYGILTTGAFPPIGLWPLALMAPVPLVWAASAARGVRSPGHAGPRLAVMGLLVAIGSIPLWAFQQRWIIDVTPVGYPLLVLYMAVLTGLIPVVIGALHRAARRLPMALTAPAGWCAVEVLRGEVLLTGYPWFLAGHPLADAPPLAAPAALLGAYFVSFLTVALAGAFADSMRWSFEVPRRVQWSAAAVAACWAAAAYIGWRSAPEPGATLSVAVVQTALPQDNKIGWAPERRTEDFARWSGLTRRAAGMRPAPSIIVWPETMFPGYDLNPDSLPVLRRLDEMIRATGLEFPGHAWFADEIVELQQQVDTTLVIGALANNALNFEPVGEGRVRVVPGERFNSVFVIAAGAVAGRRYDKVELTPFGEVIPYVWRWPLLQKRVLSAGAGGMTFDLSAGRAVGPLEIPLSSHGGESLERGGRVLQAATPICFEVTKSLHCLRLLEGDGGSPAAMILNLSNDGWFSWAMGGREQHLLAARWRCIELGVPMVRAVNTGVSASIDSRGRVRGQTLPINAEDVLNAEVTLPLAGARPTPFRAGGSLFQWIALSLPPVLVIVTRIVPTSRRTSIGS